MDIITIQELENLINLEEELFISIYLPTYSSGVDTRQNHIRFKQLLRQGEAKLYNMGLNKEEVESFLRPAKTLITETKFWQEQSEGIAIFLYSQGMKYFRLPISFIESITISNRLYIKPLLPLFIGNGQFNILALSKNEARLFRCTRQNIKEIKIEPSGMFDMQVDDDPRTNLLIRTSNPMGSTELTYNKTTQGQGNENEYEKNELTRYFRAIDQVVINANKGENIPLILAGVEYLIPIYREKSKYSNIVDEYIRGNPETFSGEELHKQAWEIMEPIFFQDKKLAKEKYEQFSGQRNKLFLNSLEEIIAAAFNGQVESLLLNSNISKWGKFDHDYNKIEINEEKQEGDQDLMEYVSLLTISRGGKVFPVEEDKVPDGNELAAVLRY